MRDLQSPRGALARLVPFTAPLVPIGGVATAYVCVNQTCTLPTAHRDEFAARLEATSGEPR